MTLPKWMSRPGAWVLTILLWLAAFWGSLLVGYILMIITGATYNYEYADLGLALAAVLGPPVFMVVSAIPALVFKDQFDSKRVFVIGGLVCGLGVVVLNLIGLIVQ